MCVPMPKLGGVKNAEEPNSVENPKTVEDLLENTGGFSWFQLFAVLILILPEMPASMIAMSPILTGSKTITEDKYSCTKFDETVIYNVTESNFCQLYSNCSRLVDSSPVARTSIVQEWDLYCDRAWIADMITSVQMAGSTLGSLVFPYLADRYGRRELFFIICILKGISGVLTGWAPNVVIFSGLRFTSGLCIGGLYVVYVNYLMEFLVPRCRTICGCVTFWAAGEMLLAVIGFYVPAWRSLSVLVALPFLVVPFAYPWLPESPRWLLCHHRTLEAHTVFNQIARWNGRSQLTFSQVESVHAQILLQNKEADALSHVGGWSRSDRVTSSSHWSPEICSIFERSSFHRQFFYLICIWFSMNLIYYGLSFNTKNLTGNPYVNLLLLGASELPGPFAGLVFSSRFGRKRTIVGFMSCSALLLTTLALIQVLPVELTAKWGLQSGHLDEMTKGLALVGRFCNAAGIGVVTTATAESFPTKLRLTHAGICCFFGNLGGILAPQLVFLATVWTIGPYLAFGFLSIFVAVLCLGLRETAKQPLNDSSVKT